jgi:nucleotide-binding universal stress UspA family protein
METRERSPILAAFSPAAAGREPVEFGLAASGVTGAPLVVVAVHRAGMLIDKEMVDDTGGDTARTLQNLREDMRRRKIDLDLRVVEAQGATAGIAQAIEKLDPELVVLGSSQRSAPGSVLVGDIAEHLMHDSPRPVAVVPKGYEAPDGGVQTIGAAFAPTAEGREALRAGIVLARAGGTRLRAITVSDARHAAEAEAAVREVADGAPAHLVVDIDVLTGDPADAIAEASRGVDLLIMGSRGRGARRAALLGSVSREVASKAACPVLILPRGATLMGEALLSDSEANLAT